MTVSTATSIDTGTQGTGAAQTISFTFPVLADTEVCAFTQDITAGTLTELTKDTHYSVSLTGTGTPNYTGGSITTLTPFVANTLNVFIYRQTTETQAYNPINNDDMDADTLEQAIDKQFMLIADLQEEVGRCIKIPRGESTTVELPNAVDRASEAVQFDASGNVETA
jgi:hypothetical protein